jgi:hypothetical protein
MPPHETGELFLLCHFTLEGDCQFAEYIGTPRADRDT